MQNNSAKFKIIPKGYQRFSLFVFRFTFLEGFTLIETVVSLAIILAAVVGPVALITRGIFDFSFAKNKLIGVNLAHEGVELVRLIREQNIMCDKVNNGIIDGDRIWNDSLPVGLWAVDVNSFTSISCGAVTLNVPSLTPFTATKLRFDTASGLYGFSGDKETIFIRRINVQTPADDTSVTPSIPSSDQLDVISLVEWQERGITGNPGCPLLGSRCVVLRERLYNWK